MRDIKKALLVMGLSDKEANVYMAMLELGPMSVLEIAKKAGVNRATTYVMIESLKRRGLVSSVDREKKTVFAAESPERLISLIEEEVQQAEEKKQALQRLLPQFMALFQGVDDKLKVRYFEGEAGIVSCREALLELVGPGQMGRAFVHFDCDMAEASKQNESQRLKFSSGTRRMRILYSTEAEECIPAFGKNIEMRPLPLSLPSFHGEVNIFEKALLIAVVKPRTMAVLIESESIANLFRVFFDTAWGNVVIQK